MAHCCYCCCRLFCSLVRDGQFNGAASVVVAVVVVTRNGDVIVVVVVGSKKMDLNVLLRRHRHSFRIFKVKCSKNV